MKGEKKIRALFQRVEQERGRRDPERSRETAEYLCRILDEKSRKMTGENRGRMRDPYDTSRIPPWAEIVAGQLYYMEKRAWTVDFFVNLAFVCGFFFLRYFGADAENIRIFSVLVSAASGCVSVLALANVLGNGCAELTETCCFNMKQMAALQLTVLGTVNLAVLVFAALYAGVQWQIPLIWMAVYVGIPFLFTVSACLMCLMAETVKNKACAVLVTGVAGTAVFGITASAPGLYPIVNPMVETFVWESRLTAGAAVCAAGIILLAVQIRRLLKEIGKGEILCTGWR